MGFWCVVPEIRDTIRGAELQPSVELCSAGQPGVAVPTFALAVRVFAGEGACATRVTGSEGWNGSAPLAGFRILARTHRNSRSLDFA